MSAPCTLHVTVAYSPAPRQVDEVVLQLPAGSTLRQAVEASGLMQRYPVLSQRAFAVSVFSRKARVEQILYDRDRVEILRPLRVDPKLARRERFNQQGAGRAGLFATRRPGVKPGY